MNKLGSTIVICIIFFGVGSYFYSLLEGRNVCESSGGTYIQGFYQMECVHQTSAAIKDSGCSTHPHKVIEQKQIKDTYVKWGK